MTTSIDDEISANIRFDLISPHSRSLTVLLQVLPESFNTIDMDPWVISPNKFMVMVDCHMFVPKKGVFSFVLWMVL